MTSFGERLEMALEQPLNRWSRLFLLVLSLVLVLSFTQPLWRISMEAPQYPEGLSLDISLYKLEGGHDGHDIAEINELNHYIGMMTIDRQQLVDLDWIPFAFCFLILMQLRAMAIGNGRSLVDLSVLISFVCLFSLGRFVYKLHAFGHFLDPHAAIHIEPFMPVILGTKQVANFTTHSFPCWGSAFVAINAIGIIGLTIWHFWRALRANRPVPAQPTDAFHPAMTGHSREPLVSAPVPVNGR